jgi:hypothetical protein
MLQEQIVLDTTSTGTLALCVADEPGAESRTFARFDAVSNKSEYRADDHTAALRHKLEFYRTPEKASGNYRGSRKSTVKYTHDVSVPNRDGSGNVVAPIVVTTTYSYPIGVSDADLKEGMRKIALLTLVGTAFPYTGNVACVPFTANVIQQAI